MKHPKSQNHKVNLKPKYTIENLWSKLTHRAREIKSGTQVNNFHFNRTRFDLNGYRWQSLLRNKTSKQTLPNVCHLARGASKSRLYAEYWRRMRVPLYKSNINPKEINHG